MTLILICVLGPNIVVMKYDEGVSKYVGLLRILNTVTLNLGDNQD